LCSGVKCEQVHAVEVSVEDASDNVEDFWIR
jgi:hypothetical protein